ncbi:pectinesterase-like [Silene latifolia]|uniref:pectinesterase-like n=1 Tax=Silene latifolia TaxID=37657 RepID=UPI003D780B50
MDSLVIPILTLICSIVSIPNVVHGNIKLSCDQTHSPQDCHSFIGKSNMLKTSQETTFLIRDYAFKITLDHARQVHQYISSMDFGSVNDRTRMAWNDCLELYDDTIQQLTQTRLSSNIPAHLDDIQTYLSAATTNYETCKNGFLDFNLPFHLESSPLSLTSNFSKSLTNVLAINAAIINSNPSGTSSSRNNGGGGRRLLTKDFPSWTSAADRKLLQSSNPTTEANLVVAKDGSGKFKTISEAIAASKKQRSGTNRFIIYVKAGIYNENVAITNKMKNLMLIGDGIDATIVTSNKNVQDGYTTFRSATFGVSGDGFIAKGITFENTAGPQKHQAVALRSGSDFSVFYSCSFKGYQDTLYVYSKRQFYKNCDIYGTVDFIFGDAVAVLQNCNIYARKPMSNQINTVTAQGRTDPNENTGIVIHNSIIEAASDLRSVQGSVKTFLGRPWHMYSRVVVMKSNIDRVVDRAGWAPWSGDFALKTLYYGEYMNNGDGASTAGRVNWAGYRVITSPVEAGKFTVGNFLAGDAWIPDTGVPFTSGL